MTKRRHTLGRVSYMPQFMRAPSRATHQPSSSCAMTRSFAAVRVVRCGGTLSSGCSTTVRRQHTASHRAQLAPQASCVRSGLKCSTQGISNGPVEVQTLKRTGWSSMQHGQNEKRCHDAPGMTLSMAERFTREESIRAESTKREQRLEAVPCKYPTRYAPTRREHRTGARAAPFKAQSCQRGPSFRAHGCGRRTIKERRDSFPPPRLLTSITRAALQPSSLRVPQRDYA